MSDFLCFYLASRPKKVIYIIYSCLGVLLSCVKDNKWLQSHNHNLFFSLQQFNMKTWSPDVIAHLLVLASGVALHVWQEKLNMHSANESIKMDSRSLSFFLLRNNPNILNYGYMLFHYSRGCSQCTSEKFPKYIDLKICQ